MTAKKFKPGQGYTQADWDEVSDIPEVTAEMGAEMKPFAETFPELAKTITHRSGERDAATEGSAPPRPAGDRKKRA